MSWTLRFPVPPRRGGPSRDHSCPACSRPDCRAFKRLSRLDESFSTRPAVSRPGSSAGSLDGQRCGKSHGLLYGWRCSWLCPFRSHCPATSVPFDQLIDQLSREHHCQVRNQKPRRETRMTIQSRMSQARNWSRLEPSSFGGIWRARGATLCRAFLIPVATPIDSADCRTRLAQQHDVRRKDFALPVEPRGRRLPVGGQGLPKDSGGEI